MSSSPPKRHSKLTPQTQSRPQPTSLNSGALSVQIWCIIDAAADINLLPVADSPLPEFPLWRHSWQARTITMFRMTNKGAITSEYSKPMLSVSFRTSRYLNVNIWNRGKNEFSNDADSGADKAASNFNMSCLLRETPSGWNIQNAVPLRNERTEHSSPARR